MDEDMEKAQVEEKPVYQAVIALTIPPKGQKLRGTCMRIDVNGQVVVFESSVLKADTLWQTDIGHLYAVPNILMQGDSLEKLRELIHQRVDNVFNGWKIAFPEAPQPVPSPMNIIDFENVAPPPAEQQPASELLKDIVAEADGIAKGKTVEINVESKLTSPISEVI
jgi:hypothetical protein